MANHCAECGAEMASHAKLCINCGYHIELGRKLSRGQVTAAPDDDQSSASRDSVSDGKTAATEQAQEPELSRRYEAGTEDNPYAPPATSDEETKISWELTESDLPKVRKVAGSAIPIYIAVSLMPCICFPLPALMLPINVFRLVQWWQLQQQFENLRRPNSFSPHVELELRFQKAFWQYVVSILLGIIWVAVFALIQLRAR